MIDIDSEESWFKAKDVAAQLEPIPESVSHAVQTLWLNHTDNVKSSQGTIYEASFESVRRMDKTSKLKTPLYFAAQGLYPDRFELCEDDTSKALIRVLQPGLFAAILGLVYLHRRLNKICANPEWQNLSKEFVLNMELGFLTGSSFPGLGPAIGTLLGGIRYAALGALLRKSADQYSRYRNLHRNKFNLEDEQMRWGCDHTQISAYLIQKLGFRKDFIDVGAGLRAIEKGFDRLPVDLKSWRAGIFFLDGVKEDKTEFANPAYAQVVGVTPENIEIFKSKIQRMFEQGSTFSWMFKSADDS